MHGGCRRCQAEIPLIDLFKFAELALYPEVAAHVMRVTETAHWLEWQDWAAPILQQPYAIKGGQLHIPDVPGVGIEWNEKAVEAHRI
ncbi:MAG: hypothetical protein Q8M31_00015 [Beijerinckiaceae bacterium]|nr:hypothetical protein [Beijerinckiaceae bacterium]